MIQVARSVPAPLPWAIPWKTGRFYTNPFSTRIGSGTGIGPSMQATPFFVPNAGGVTIASMGIEVTSVASAGSLLRLGLYTASAEGIPFELVVDGGTVASDALGFASVTVSQFLRQGWHYVAWINSTNSGQARASSSAAYTGSIGGNAGADTTIYNGIFIVTVSSQLSVATDGLPGHFPVGTGAGGAFNSPSTSTHVTALVGI